MVNGAACIPDRGPLWALSLFCIDAVLDFSPLLLLFSGQNLSIRDGV